MYEVPVMSVIYVVILFYVVGPEVFIIMYLRKLTKEISQQQV